MVSEKAERCQRLIDDPDLKEAFITVKQSFINAMIDAPTEDKDGLMELKKLINLLDKVENELHKAIRQGKKEQHMAEQPPFLGKANAAR